MKALSVRAPWWWFILHGGKDIENRDWPTSFRGTIYLHAGKFWKQDEVYADIQEALDCCVPHRSEVASKLSFDVLRAGRGCLVGQVEIVDCVSRSGGSRWFFGDYGFVLANPVAFDKPIPYKGELGFFEVTL